MKEDEELLFILDQDISSEANALEENIAVIIYLYYIDTVKNYIPFIENIPEEYSIYVISSNQNVLYEVKELLTEDNIVYILKENRGRDMSAFLVAAASIVKEYDRVCFIHDKREHAEYLKEDTDFWIYSLWMNTLGTEAYIKNVNQLFDNNKTLGLLVPPEPYGEFLWHWYGDTWFANYESTKQLAEFLGLKVDVSQDKQVTALSTVFWARTKALKKLTEYPWKYEDFPEEPLPFDGTISHAIERIFSFVTLDAGFQSGTIMTKTYAEEFLPRVQRDMRYMWFLLREREDIFMLHQIKCAINWEKTAGKFFKEHKYIYIYGAGYYGTKIDSVLKNKGIEAAGFVVSNGYRKECAVSEKKVFEIGELEKIADIGVIIGVSYELRPEIKRILFQYGITDYIEIL